MENHYKIPDWADPSDNGFGNVSCKVCQMVQAPFFRACIYCCAHKALSIIEGRDGGLDFECDMCGKNFDFDINLIIRRYKLVMSD